MTSSTTLEQLVGERTVPQLWHENYWFRRHEIAYLALAGRVRDAARATARTTRGTTSAPLVVEAGCGEGYGMPLLERGLAAVPGARIVGLDYDAAAAAHALRAYGGPGTGVARTNLAHLPLPDAAVAAVVNFQVIEHLWTPWEFLAECRRVLAPGGVLLVTTPNRLTFSPGLGRGEKPQNPFHVKEFDTEELVGTVQSADGSSGLAVEEVLGVVHGPRLRAWEADHGDLIAAQLATSPAGWAPGLAEFVTSVTAEDFKLVPVADDVLDLVVVARREDS
ncbi:class I SAM-dependent methyltransferase [Spongisporangium articulatum]|uniref:Class I SAM-dependent methyltransferase n=1 Tax=Spongisporangium articulatum TaxID=3362603 RepID=A0ABW8AN73_9ACTN